jgi:hypothetical protein
MSAVDVGDVLTAAAPAVERPDTHRTGAAERDLAGPIVLWTERDIEALDMFYGPGGKAGSPDVASTFMFDGVDRDGTQKKIIVLDDRGRQWTVKYGPEARPETAASRIIWAMGYHADQDYFVEAAPILGLPRGEYEAREVRFERRDDGLSADGVWQWRDNPFIGTREFDGLKTLMVVLNNWDLKTSNNKVVRAPQADLTNRVFYVGDVGATFGRTGSLTHMIFGIFGPVSAGTKGKAQHYAAQELIDDVRDGVVKFHYKGRLPDAVSRVPLIHAKWMGDMLARLSDAQLEDTFRAAGYNPSEVATLVHALRERTRQLQRLP